MVTLARSSAAAGWHITQTAAWLQQLAIRSRCSAIVLLLLLLLLPPRRRPWWQW